MTQKKSSNLLQRLTGKYSILLVLIVLFLICTVLNSNFLTWGNLTNVSRQISVTTILAFGQTILIICGMLDLSSGSVMAFAGTLSVIVYKTLLAASMASLPAMLIAVLVSILLAVFCNLLNGIMVTYFKTPAFIATLAMQTMARGAALMMTAGQNIYQIGDYVVPGQGSLWIIPIPIIIMLVFFAFTSYFLVNTRMGRSVYAIGGNEEAAVASGIAVNSIKLRAYLINGALVGVAAVLYMSRVNAGLPNGAQGAEFDALTTTIIGGTSFSGGLGTAGGTLIGAFIVGFLNNIMNLTKTNSYLQQIIRGLIIALAVIYDIYAKSRRTRRKLGSLDSKE